MVRKIKQAPKPAPEPEKEKIKKTKIRVVGIGGGAGNIVSELALRIKKASFAAANTDLQALRTLRRSVLRFNFGGNLTHGLGTGMNFELAREAALSEKERIKNLFKDQDFCVLVASLGGGVGSGAGPVFAKIAKSSGAITLGVFTLPFKFEGEKKQEIARESLQKLRPYLNAVVILPNDRIFQIVDKDTPLREALSCINKTLADSLEGLIETIYLPGLINIDFADLKTIMQGRGRFTYLNTIEVQGKDKTLEAVKKVLNCPLYPYTIRGAKGILFNITGEKGISLSEVSQISKMISELANSEAKIIFGISQSREYQDKIKVALLATACDAKILSEKARPVRKHRFSTGAKKPRKIKKKKSRKKALPKPQKKRKKPGKKAKSKARKIKIKVEREEALPTNRGEKPEQEAEVSPAILPNEGTIDGSIRKEFFGGLRVRKTGLQIRKEAEEAEKEFLEKEKVWEPPAFLRQQQNK